MKLSTQTPQCFVDMAEICTQEAPHILTCLGLGSCIGFCAYDPMTRIGGMAHLVLPSSGNRSVRKPGKFVDTGIPVLLGLIEQAGANLSRVVVAYAGGAQIFRFGHSTPHTWSVGHQNQIAVEECIRKLNLKCIAKDIGGSQGRTVRFHLETSKIIIHSLRSRERLLCRLKE